MSRSLAPTRAPHPNRTAPCHYISLDPYLTVVTTMLSLSGGVRSLAITNYEEISGRLPEDLAALPGSRALEPQLNRASEVEMGGEHRGQRIEQGGPATFSQRTSLWSAQPFVGQHHFRHRTLVQKVQRDDGFPALRCSA